MPSDKFLPPLEAQGFRGRGGGRAIALSARDPTAIEGIRPSSADTSVGRDFAKRGELFDGYHPEMEALHLENASLLEQAIDAIGWPVRSTVGDEGAAAAFVIAQHAISRPALQRRALELILEAIPVGGANPLDAAYLADRIAMFEGRPQTFGTQFDWNEAGEMAPAPIRDRESVDERRASVGLGPLSDAIAEMRARTAEEGGAPPPDLAQRRAEFEGWARRVGWRD